MVGSTNIETLGEVDIDLSKHEFNEALDDKDRMIKAFAFECKDKKGQVVCAVKLAFSKVPNIGFNITRLAPLPMRLPVSNSFSGSTNIKTPLSGDVPKSFAGDLHIKVYKIQGFAGYTGFMDKTDPFVR